MKIVVVGAGVIGLACAYELLQDGHDVVVLDSSRAGQAASHGNAAKVAIAEAGPVPAPGMVVQGLKWMLRSDSPLYVKPTLSPPFVRFMVDMARHCNASAFRAGLEVNLGLARRADHLFDEWAAEGVEFELHQRGVLLAYEDSEAMEARLRHQDLFDRHGAKVEVLDRDAVHALEPALSDRIASGLYYPDDRQIEPDSLNISLVRRITALGGSVVEDAAVTGFDSGTRGVETVRTADGRAYPCDGVVLAAGTWTGRLAEKLGVRLPLQPGKGYSIDYTPPPVELRTSLTLDGPHIAITPLDGMVRVAGTMEFSGFDQTVTRTRIGAIKAAVAANFVGWDPEAPHRPEWAGLRPMTPDGLPIVGPLAPGANAWVATGHAMLGLTLAPTTGREIRELVRGAGASDPATSPERFRRPSRRSMAS